MPDRAQHTAQAEPNESFYRHLASSLPSYSDWQVTALFYAALHWVDAYLAALSPDGVHPQTHGARREYIARSPDLHNYLSHYQELRNRSEDARYEAMAPKDAEVVELEIARFRPIRDHVRSLLGLA